LAATSLFLEHCTYFSSRIHVIRLFFWRYNLRVKAVDLDFSTFLEYYFRWQYLLRRLTLLN